VRNATSAVGVLLQGKALWTMKPFSDIVSVPEVRSAFLVSGRYDLVVHVMVQDTRQSKDLALDQFTIRPGVTRIETYIIFNARRRYELPVFRSLG
jgi:DNA-binding Lrp family transcriptional regulator